MKKTQTDADQRQRHRAQNVPLARRVRQECRRERRHAVREGTEEDTSVSLCHAVSGKADDDARENCMDARVSVIRRMANTMDTTVMMEAAIRQDDLGDLRVGVRGE